MAKKIPGLSRIDRKKTDNTPLALHDNAKANKYGSAEFTHTEF